MLRSFEIRLRSNHDFSMYLITGAAEPTMATLLIIFKSTYHFVSGWHLTCPCSMATNLKLHVIVYYRNDKIPTQKLICFEQTLFIPYLAVYGIDPYVTRPLVQNSWSIYSGRTVVWWGLHVFNSPSPKCPVTVIILWSIMQLRVDFVKKICRNTVTILFSKFDGSGDGALHCVKLLFFWTLSIV
jgi:hypothetical protein